MTYKMVWREEQSLPNRFGRLDPDTGTVAVVGSARVHLGSIDLSESPFRGGGLGFSVPEIGFQGAVGVSAPLSLPQDVESRLHHILSSLNVESESIPYGLTSLIPSHTGLGSTTQYLVAFVQAFLAFCERSPLSLSELTQLGIGAESSLGVRLALCGGPVIDLGADLKKTVQFGGQVRIPFSGAIRIDFPKPWAGMICWPSNVTGIADKAEEAFWRRALPTRSSRTLSATRGLLFGIMPGLAQEDFGLFLAGLREFALGSTKPDEWQLQGDEVMELAAFFRSIGHEPFLSSVGPTLVLFGETFEQLSLCRYRLLESYSNWNVVMTHFGQGD